MKQDRNDLESIEVGLLALHKATFQHRAWEDIQLRAGVSLDRASAVLLKVVSQHEQASCRMQDIAKMLGIEAPSVTRTVQHLEEPGFIKRQTDPADKRAIQVSLTKKGQQQLDRLQRARQQRLAEALQQWSKTDQKKLGALLQKLAEDLGNTY